MSHRLVLVTLAMCSLIFARPAPADVGPEAAQALYERVTPSLVGVKFTWESEVGRRELSGAGTVVRDDGLIVCQLAVFDMRIPDDQLKEFKIVVPDPAGGDPTELDARLHGRDERYNLAFLQPTDPSADGRKWQPVTFEDVPVRVGETVMSVGLLPEAAGYKTYFAEAAVSVALRGETPQVLVQGGALTGVGSPVFNSEGKAIGVVNFQPGTTPFLNDPQNALASINNPPRFFLPARDFLPALAEPPQEGKPVAMPWIGVPQLTGLTKDVAEVFDLVNQPAIQVGEVIPNTPAAEAGLKRGDIIVKLNDQPLERGDEPDELPQIFRRRMMRMKVGESVKLGVLRAKGEPLQDITITTAEMPPRPNTAKRWYAEDLGFSAREVVFTDTYSRRLPADAKGVVVALIRPQSAAQTGGLQMNDMVTELNRQPVTDLASFQKAYESFRADKPKEAVVMVVLREGNTQTIRIEPPQ
jgi:S1-C subfamily serine protease